MNSDTPLTDREPKHWINGSDGMMAVRVEFARDLERRLTEANETIASLAHVIAGKCPKHGTVTVFGHLKRTGCEEWHCPACEEINDIKFKLQIARDALRLYEYTVVVGGRYAALEALEVTKP